MLIVYCSLVRLDTTDAKKLNLLKTWDPAVHDAVLWLRSHRELFDEEVFEPPILSVSVPGQKNTAQIEAAFSGDQMKVQYSNSSFSLLRCLTLGEDVCSAEQERSGHFQSPRERHDQGFGEAGSRPDVVAPCFAQRRRKWSFDPRTSAPNSSLPSELG